jgi:predicted secreted Zn-dependent protease
MDTKLRRLAASLVVLACSGTSNGQAEVRLQERTEYFDIGFVSGDADQLWKGLKRNGPFTHTGTIVGTTKGHASVTRTVQQTPTGCFLRSADVNVSLIVTLPAWSWRNNAPPEHQAYWDCVERTVTIHENRHVEIWKETAHRINATLQRMTDAMPCAEVTARVSDVFNRQMQDSRGRQATFDADDQKRQRYEACMPVTSAAQRTAAAAAGPATSARSGMAVASEAATRELIVGELSTTADQADPSCFFDGPIGNLVVMGLLAIVLSAFGLAAVRHVMATAAKSE